MRNPLAVIKNGIIDENPTFVLVLGLCPTIATSTSAINGFGMGLAATAVLMGSNTIISLIRKIIPDEIRIPAFIVVIAGFVTVVQLLIQAYAPALDKALGIFIPLIVVNCIIIARAEAFAFKNGVVDSFFDGVGIGLGFTIALTAIGCLRELIGNGSVFGYQIVSAAIYQPTLLIILAPGGFMTIGTLIALFRHFQMKKEEAKTGKVSNFDGWKQLDACQGCALHGLCGGGNSTVPCAKIEATNAAPAAEIKKGAEA